MHARKSQQHPREKSRDLQRRLYLAAERSWDGTVRSDILWQTFCFVGGAVVALHAAGAKVVGKPYEGKPHVRFEVAGGGDQDFGLRRHSLTLPADGWN